MPHPNTSTIDLWDRFLSTPTPQDEELLVRAYLPLALRTIDRVCQRFPAHVDSDDTAQNGYLGLVLAIRTYVPERGKFETWAAKQIEYRVLDGQRSTDWLPSGQRTNVNHVRRALAVLEQEGNHSPSSADIAAHLGLDVATVEQALQDAATAPAESLDMTESEGMDLHSALGAVGRHDDEYSFAERDMLLGAVRRLPERSQQIVALFFYEGLTQAQIGTVFGITESRVSQLLSQASGRLRLLMADTL